MILPNELLYLILGEIPQNKISKLARVSKLFRLIVLDISNKKNTFRDAVISGNMMLILHKDKFLHDHIDFNWIMRKAANGGHFEIVKWIAKLYDGNNFNDVMQNAAKGGHFEIIKWAVENGGNNFNGVMSGAAKGGHFEIIKWAVEHGGNNFNGVMCYAAWSGHFEIVKWVKEYKK